MRQTVFKLKLITGEIINFGLNNFPNGFKVFIKQILKVYVLYSDYSQSSTKNTIKCIIHNIAPTQVDKNAR